MQLLQLTPVQTPATAVNAIDWSNAVSAMIGGGGLKGGQVVGKTNANAEQNMVYERVSRMMDDQQFETFEAKRSILGANPLRFAPPRSIKATLTDFVLL